MAGLGVGDRGSDKSQITNRKSEITPSSVSPSGPYSPLSSENELKKMWDKGPVDKGLHYDKDTGKVSCATGKGHQLIIEATEYYVLEKLSSHLTDYFNRPHFDEQELHTFARNDIPDVLLSNRFLELFSKPMEDRPLFSTEDSPPHQKGRGVSP